MPRAWLRFILCMERYVLLSEGWLERLRGVELSREVLEELVLATASEPVVEIGEEVLAEVAEVAGLWREGYAVPFSALVELLGRERAEDALRSAVAVIPEEELVAEPDASFEVAREFCGLVRGERVLDIGSGFGWVPVLLSQRCRVFALDSAYDRRVVRVGEGLRVEGTNIVLSGWVAALGEVRCYADFATLFWSAHGARMESIGVLCGDARRAEDARWVRGAEKPPSLRGFFDCATAFFSFNHMEGWEEVLRSLKGVLAGNARVYVALYPEHLRFFPVKGTYRWEEELGVRVFGREELVRCAEDAGYGVEVVRCGSLAEFVVLHR